MKENLKKLLQKVFCCETNSYMETILKNNDEDNLLILSLILDEKQFEVINLRFGLKGQEGNDRSKVAILLNQPYEKIRNIEARSLMTLRHPKNIRFWISGITDEEKSLHNKNEIINQRFLKMIHNLPSYEISLDSFDLPNEVLFQLKQKGFKTLADLMSAEKSSLPQFYLNNANTVKNLKSIEDLERLVLAVKKEDIETKGYKEILKNADPKKIHISELGFSLRVFNALKRGRIENLDSLLLKSEKGLLRIRGLGQNGLKEIKDVLGKIQNAFQLKANLLKTEHEIKNIPIDQISIYDLGLSTRTVNALRFAKIHTLQDLYSKDIRELENIRNLGKFCIEEIKLVFEKYSDILPQKDCNNPRKITINQMNLSERTYNVLKRSGLYTLHDILTYDKDIFKVRGLGQKTFDEIKAVLNKYNVSVDAENVLDNN